MIDLIIFGGFHFLFCLSSCFSVWILVVLLYFLLLLLFWFVHGCSLLLVVVVCCRCCCCFCYYVGVLLLLLLFVSLFVFVCCFVHVVLFLSLLFLLFVCPRATQQINKKTTKTIVSYCCLPFVLGKALPRERPTTQNKKQKTRGLFHSSFVFHPCCVFFFLCFICFLDCPFFVWIFLFSLSLSLSLSLLFCFCLSFVSLFLSHFSSINLSSLPFASNFKKQQKEKPQ